MALDRCPGSHTPPHALVDRETSYLQGRVMVDSYGICGHCRREYYITSAGVLHVHKGLPKRPDGGCPYRCPYYCDFDCYVSGARI